MQRLSVAASHFVVPGGWNQIRGRVPLGSRAMHSLNSEGAAPDRDPLLPGPEMRPAVEKSQHVHGVRSSVPRQSQGWVTSTSAPAAWQASRDDGG